MGVSVVRAVQSSEQRISLKTEITSVAIMLQLRLSSAFFLDARGLTAVYH
jgi:hypothetical protein